MFTTYSASAGSGKTTHLVADYIALCFREDSRHIDRVLGNGDSRLNIFQKVLAITFTNNAAAEMKDRIVQTLREFAFVPKAELSGRADAIYGIIVQKLFVENRPDDEKLEAFMQKESLELLRSIIYDYARFSLTTIDSFFQRIIRSAALSLNLNLNYSVQVDLNEFYIKAIDQLLNELSAESQLATRILFMLDNNMEDSGKLNVDRELKGVLDILYADAEKNYEYLNKLRTLDTKEFQKTIRQWRETIKRLPAEISQAVKPIAEEANAKISELTFSFHKGLKPWFDKVVEDPIKNFCEDIDDFRRDEDGSFFRKKSLNTEEQALADDVMSIVTPCFNRMVEIQKPKRQQYLDALLMSKNADKLLLLFDLQEKMNEIKELDNFFILSETNKLIYENIKDKEIPEIFDQIKFEHFFIDEFQDTSLMQWQDLLPLISNRALATGGQVTLFGDVKQAIYRFRNGDANLFYNLIDYDRMRSYPELRNVGREEYANETLKKNFRSSQSVVAFNNLFFNYFSENLELQEFYADVEQEIHSCDAGLVQLFIKQDDNDKALIRDLYRKDADLEQYIQDTDDIDIEDAEVLRAVSEALARGYQYGDIAILYSGNAKSARIANILLERGFPVVTEQSLVLNASPNVNLLIYTMKYLQHPDDPVAQTTILYYLAKMQRNTSFLSEKLLTLATTDFNTLVTELIGKPLPTHEWLSQPLLLLVKEMIRFYGLDEQQDPFVVDFVNILLSYLQNRNGELTPFLLWWQQLLDTDTMFTLTLPADMNAIKVCTIHKSKGLEYPVVILPFSSSTRQPKPIWTDKNEQIAYVNLSKSNSIGSSFEEEYLDEEREMKIDMLNLLYVAHTRARDVLYVITSVGKEGSYGKYLSDFIAENPTLDVNGQPLAFAQDEKDGRLFYVGDRAWKNRAQEKTLKKPITPKIYTSEFNIDKVAALVDATAAPSEQIRIGNFVHDYLAQLTAFPQTMEEADQLLADMEEAQRARLSEAFRHILDDADLRPCFAPNAKILNECSILDSDGNVHRPDRIVFLEDKVVVIDYKTGQPYPKYQEQIDLYCALLRQMGHARVEGKLLYV